MKNLIHHQRIELRDAICHIMIDRLSDKENYELQGRNMFKLGFSDFEAKYPSDTYVGTHRLDGYKAQQIAPPALYGITEKVWILNYESKIVQLPVSRIEIIHSKDHEPQAGYYFKKNGYIIRYVPENQVFKTKRGLIDSLS